MVSLGFSLLFIKSKKAEGYDAVLDFLNDMLEYQEKEYKPNQKVMFYMNVITIRIVFRAI